MSHPSKILESGLFSVLLGVVLALSINPVFAQSTSSQIRVAVVSDSGAPAAGVDVRVTHIPTDRSQVLTSDDAGNVTVRGL